MTPQTRDGPLAKDDFMAPLFVPSCGQQEIEILRSSRSSIAVLLSMATRPFVETVNEVRGFTDRTGNGDRTICTTNFVFFLQALLVCVESKEYLESSIHKPIK